MLRQGVFMQVKTEEELAKAVNNNENRIEIEGDLAEKVIKIKASGNVAWAVAIGSIGIAVIAIISLFKNSESKNSQSPKVAFVASGIGATTAAGAVGVLGLATTISAIKIAVSGGGKDVLKKLRNYKMEKISDTKIVLKNELLSKG